MVTERNTGGHPPIGGFEVRTEQMVDGRRIHYYEWPDEAEQDGDQAEPGGGETAPSVDGTETPGAADGRNSR